LLFGDGLAKWGGEREGKKKGYKKDVRKTHKKC